MAGTRRSTSRGRSASKSRSKSPAASAGGNDWSDFGDPIMNAGALFALFGALVYFDNSGTVVQRIAPANWVAWLSNFDGDGPCSCWPYSIVLTGHVLNFTVGKARGWWAESFARCFFGAFAGKMLWAVISGNGILGWIANEKLLALTLVCWWATNHSPFGVDVSSFQKMIFDGKLQRNFYALCTLSYNLNLVIEAVQNNSGGDSFLTPLIGFSISAAIAAVTVGAAEQNWPIDHGMNVAWDGNWERALIVSSYLGLGHAPIIGDIVNQIEGTVSNLIGIRAGGDVVIFFNAISFLLFIGGVSYPDPFEPIYDVLRKVSGV